MKVSIARIRLYLKTGKKLSDGTNPIMLMCSFNGRKEVSTSYSCTPKYWDKKAESVKKGYPNYVMINYSINKIKQEAIERRNEYERLGEVYTPSMIISPKEQLSAHRNDVKSLIDDYISEKVIKENTAYNWKYAYNLLNEYNGGKNMIVNEIKLSYVKNFINWLKTEKTLSDGVVKQILSKVAALCNFAIQKGLMSADDYPFKNFRYTLQFKTASKMDYIHWRTLSIMKQMLMDDIIVANESGMWHYNDEALDKLMDRNNALFGRYLFMAMVLFQGLAPVDIAHLRKQDMTIKKIGDSFYYCWDTKRSKTNKQVKIRIKTNNTYNDMIVKMMLMFNNSEWLLPILNGFTMTTPESTRKHRVSYTLYLLSPKLKEWFMRINEKVVEHNVANNDNVPLVELDCTFYSARHSFAMAYMAKGGKPMALATLLGRSANTLAQYIKQLEEETDLADAVGVIDI